MNGKKTNNAAQSFDSFDIREYQGAKTNIHRFDYDDLFDENKDIIEDVFRVKHSSTPKRGERWKIFRNDEIVVELDGSKLSNKYCEFLRSLDGVRWLLAKAKTNISDIRNISRIKTTLKKEMQK
jgi:hypothetical protein